MVLGFQKIFFLERGCVYFSWLAFFILCFFFRLCESSSGDSVLYIFLQSAFFASIYLFIYILLLFQGVWRLSLCWIGIPYFLFAFGWLRWYWAVPCVLVWLYALLRVAHLEKMPQKFKPDGWYLAAFLLVMVWAYLSGAGGHGHQSPDYAMHNGRLLDLIQHVWPVRYIDGLLVRDPEYGPKYTYLVGYSAYYLPAALWGKMAGYRSALEFLHIWTLFGMWLGLAWLQEFLGRRMIFVAALALLLFGGLDVAGIMLTLGRNPASDSPASFVEALYSFWLTLPADTGNLDFWPVSQFGFFFGNYISNAGQLYWSPHQAVAAWVVGGLLLKAFLDKKVECFCFLFALLVFWSPMNMAATVFFPLVMLFQNGRKSFKNSLTFENVIAGGSLMLVFSAYYFSGSAGVNPFNWVWNSADIGAVWWVLLFFHFFAWGVYAIQVFPESIAIGGQRLVFMIVLCCSLFAMSLVSYGLYNDLLCRGSIILMFFMMVMVLQRLKSLLDKRRNLLLIALVFSLVLGSWSGLQHVYRSLVFYDEESSPQSVINSIHGWEFLGPVDSFFVRVFSRSISIDDKSGVE